jgi:hypothetical protein
MKYPRFDARSKVPAESFQITHCAEGDELARDVSDRGGFHLQGVNGQTRRVGGCLAEQAVF